MFPFMGRAHWRAHHRAFHHPGGGPGGHHGPPGMGFGVRRPMRFLVERLGLDDAQASELAKAMEELRLEREQADLDLRRARARIADLVEVDPLDKAALDTAAEARVAAARRQRDATVAAVIRLHAALKPEQRLKLAMLLRSGPIDL